MIYVDQYATSEIRHRGRLLSGGYRLLADDGDELALCRLAGRIGIKRWRVTVARSGARYLVVTGGQRRGAIAHGAREATAAEMADAIRRQLDRGVALCRG